MNRAFIVVLLTAAFSGKTAFADQLNASTGAQTKSSEPNYQLHDLGAVENGHSYARAVNAKGNAAGWVTFNISGSQRPALFEVGKLPTPIYTDGPGEATGINDDGEVIGWYWRGNIKQAFLWKGQQLQLLMSPVGGHSMATGINNRSEIVGWFEVSPGVSHGFYYHKGRMVDLGSWGCQSSQVTGINKHGDIVGFRDKIIGNQVLKQGVQLLQGKRAVLLSPPSGFDNLVPMGINDRGNVTGKMWSSDRPWDFTTNAFATRDGKVVDLQRPNCCFGTVGVAMNNKGVVVGYNFDRNGDPHENLTLWDPKQGQIHLSTLARPLGWHQLTEGNAITDDGVIVGAGWQLWSSNGRQHAIMLIPKKQ